MNRLKKLSTFAFSVCTLLGVASHQASAADLSIVIDDSAGMCGYLDAPTDQNAYKKSLIKLLQAKDASHLDVNAFFLSDMNKALSVGTALDRVIQAKTQQCPFAAATSPLHQGVDLAKIKSKSVILVTDLLFDEGSQGSSDSRSAFISAFDQLAQKQNKDATRWFQTSAGMMGIHSPFNGNYYSVQNKPTVDYTNKNIERPFYVVWLSSDAQFFPFLNQMTHLWLTPNWKNKKYIDDGIFAVRLLPVSSLISVYSGLFLNPVTTTFKNELPTPSIYYGMSHKKRLDVMMPNKGSGEYPIVTECFKTSSNPLVITFDSKCAKDGSNEVALFKANKFPQSIILNYPLLNRVSGLQRSFKVNVDSNGYMNPTQAFYRETKDSDIFQMNPKNKKNMTNLVVHIQGLKAGNSLLANSPRIKNKVLSLQVSESFSANSYALQPIYQLAKLKWSSEKEPCLDQDLACKTALQRTYLLENLVTSLTVRLNANQKAATLLNQQAQQPAIIQIQQK